MPDSTPDTPLDASISNTVGSGEAERFAAVDSSVAARTKRNDSISPLVIIAVILFWVLQSSFTAPAGRVLHPRHTAAPRSISPGEMPSDVASGIPDIELQAKQSYLPQLKSLDDAEKSKPGKHSSSLSRFIVGKPPLQLRREALKTATDLLRRYPGQAAIARDVILLRAETGAAHPLALLIPHTSKTAKTPAKPLSPLQAYDPVKGEPSGSAKLRAAERQMFIDLFPPGGGLSRADEIRVDGEIARLPQLRWWGLLALHQAAQRSNDNAAENRTVAQITRDARNSTAGVTLTGLVALGAAVAGLVCLFLLFPRRHNGNRRLDTGDGSVLAPRAPLIRDEDRRLGAGDLANLFFLYLALFTGISFAISSAPNHLIRRAVLRLPYEQQVTAEILLNFVVTAACGLLTLAAIVWLARRRGANLAQEIGLNLGGRSLPRTALFGFLGWSISLVLSSVVGLTAKYVFHGAPDPANSIIPLIMAAPSGVPALLMYILAAFLAPFFEETMFRGLFFNAARLRLGAPAAILLTGAAFGLAHPVGIAEQFALATLGAVFAWMAYTKKSLLPGMLAHFYQNTFVFGNMFFSLMFMSRPHLI